MYVNYILLNSRAIEDFYVYFCNCYDILTRDSPDIAIVTAGDFSAPSNGFQEKIIFFYLNIILLKYIYPKSLELIEGVHANINCNITLRLPPQVQTKKDRLAIA